jgi:YebC/PmpR family DNA-binding regulatory protein
MSGHSKWANIKHHKAKVDAQRANVFTKLGRVIFAATRQGGGDPNTNLNLKLAITNARAASMPVDNISRLITRASGEAEGINYEEAFYEGYAAGGVAVLVQILTDNRNRTASEIRFLFSRNGGNLGESGCVAWMFELKGLLQVTTRDVPGDPDELMLDLIENGAEDVREEENLIEIVTAPQDYDRIKTYLDAKGIKLGNAELTMLPKTTVPVNDAETAEKILKLLDALDENDDVQNAYANFDIPDEVLNGLE